MRYTIEFEQEVDGRWIASIPAIPGVLAYGKTQALARRNVEALAFRVMNDDEQGSEGTVDIDAQLATTA